MKVDIYITMQAVEPEPAPTTRPRRRNYTPRPQPPARKKYRWRDAWLDGMCGWPHGRPGRYRRYTDDVLDYHYVTEVLD